MDILLRIYRSINTLSLDVSAGAVICALFFGQILQVHILPYGLATLALTVWIIYTIDHLRDAKSIGNSASSHRHRFHQRNFRWLFVFLIIAIVVDGMLILFIRKQVFIYGVVLGAVVGCYLLVQRALYFLKEVFVAMLYTMGVLLPSVAVTTVQFTTYHKVLLATFFLIAWLNLLIFSWYDKDRDATDRLRSIVTLIGRRLTAWLISTVFVVVVSLSIYLVVMFNEVVIAVVFILMTMILLLIFRLPNRFRDNDTFRFLGDAIFYVPAILLLWAN
jgi:4-hydroxybenzoate polyprenyltransferase